MYPANTSQIWFVYTPRALQAMKANSLQVHCFFLPAHLRLASIFSVQRTYYVPVMTSCHMLLPRFMWVLRSFSPLLFPVSLLCTVESSTCEKQFSAERKAVSARPQPASPPWPAIAEIPNCGSWSGKWKEHIYTCWKERGLAHTKC